MLGCMTHRTFSAVVSLGLLCSGSGLTVPLTNAKAPFQIDIPAGWVQRDYPQNMPGIIVMAPGTPPAASLQLFFPPNRSQGAAADAAALKEFIGGSEEGATGGGRATLKRISERPVTVSGIKGTQRDYEMTLKANGAVVRMQFWYGIGPKNLFQFNMTTAAKATPAQLAVFSKLLSTVKFK
jgi:hypothetical protein